MGDEHEIAEFTAIAVRRDWQCDAAEDGPTFLMFAAERQRYQAGPGRQHGVTELAREFVAEAGRTHTGNRQAAGRDDQCGRTQFTERSPHPETLVDALDAF